MRTELRFLVAIVLMFLVLIGREGGVERGYAELREEVAAALGRAAAGRGDSPRRPRKGSRR